MHNYDRSERIANLIKQEISNMLISGFIKDPRLTNVTITFVSVSKDIKNATIYFETSQTSLINDIIEGFKKAKGFIKKNLAQALYLKKMPDIRFEYDNRAECTEKIEKILESLKK